ncbi:MAG TPA: BamA/TamA family outer membrane protein [Gemmatimonadales bacterium]|nr:BamA/TamA family outer membrane protein [Gemmatimonadales bacterium]
MTPRLSYPARAGALLALALGGLAFGPSVGRAQYFGRNKVQYETFHFQVLRTDHFDIYFYPEEQSAADQAARIAERWYARESQLFDHELSGRQPLILYASPAAFQQTNAIPGDLGEGTGGVTEAIKRRIVLPLGSSLAETNHVIGHELVHAFQYDITGSGRGGQMPAATQMPLWFIEGMAEYVSLGPLDPHTAMWMRDAALNAKLPKWRQLDDPNFFPYRYGQALWAYIAGRWGDEAVGRLLRSATKAADIDQAFLRETGMSGNQLDSAWQADLRKTYQPLVAQTDSPSHYGERLIAGRDQASGLNVGPVVSPDGSRIVFYSARDLFSIEMYMADARTGRVLQRVTRTAVDPHLSSLEFINSAGSFDGTGDRFVFSAQSRGRPVLDLLEVQSGRVAREITFPNLGEILHPSWSPDGRYVAFAALSGGLTDLYLYDLETDSLRQLTHDAYADLEPAWSPDGRKLAFVTDRFSTDLRTLVPGNYRLALMDPFTDSITPLPSFPDGKNIDPQWSPDGASIYFLSDRTGITNIYKLDVATGRQSQVTNLLTGVTGITSLSPALSVAHTSGRVVYSVYEHGRYAVYAADSAAALAGAPLTATTSPTPAMLPPQARPRSELLTLLADSTIGEKYASTETVTSYRPRLGLDYVAQPSLAVGADRFGTFVAGGVTLYWSDMLGDRNLATMLQVEGNFKNLAGLVAYQNTAHRLNWAVAVQQIPYVQGGYSYGVSALGDTAYQQLVVYREINREADFLVAYPLSDVQRVELQTGVRNIAFDAQAETQAFSPVTGALFYDVTQNLSAPPSVTMATAGAALVYDNSFFGATSPILGKRYRVEVDPTVGSLQFYSVLADYRDYFMPARPFTIAARLMHYGRYGRDSEDSLHMYPLFMGYQGLVRGYDYNSFDASECVATATDPCPVYDQLVGTRLLVGNLELRFPLLGVLGLGHGYYGAFPIEAAIFGDGGVAWHQGQTPSIFGGSRKAVTSAGAAMRVNLFGFAVIEVDYVRPFDRPGKGWLWQFGLTPGF